MGIELLTSRQTKNPSGAILLLTDGQDNQTHDYSQLMQRLPNGILCHAFGYGPDHTAALLAQLAEQGNGGTFTYIVSPTTFSIVLILIDKLLIICVEHEISNLTKANV
jgi:hypothetical protein